MHASLAAQILSFLFSGSRPTKRRDPEQGSEGLGYAFGFSAFAGLASFAAAGFSALPAGGFASFAGAAFASSFFSAAGFGALAAGAAGFSSSVFFFATLWSFGSIRFFKYAGTIPAAFSSV